METEKLQFEQERDKVLKDLPQSIRDTFGAIGFAYSEEYETFMPVLIVSPYAVPPKPIRDVYWWDFYSKAKRAKKLKDLSFLVYHYGAPDLEDCYSFVEQDEFESYESGQAKGWAEIPPEIEQKLKQGETLTEEEEARVRAIKEMEEDLSKDPTERKRGKLDFQELHELTESKKRKR